jgi:hypothetical protein
VAQGTAVSRADNFAKGDREWSPSLRKFVETEPIHPSPKRKLGRRNFALIHLDAATAIAATLKEPIIAVVALIHYLDFEANGAAFPLSNELALRYGVNRKAKQRALRRLARAGIIRVEQRGNQAPVVALLKHTT